MCDMLRKMETELTRMHHRLKGQVAALDVKGEFVDMHPAGADQNLVVLDSHQAVTVDGEMRTRRGFVFLSPVWLCYMQDKAFNLMLCLVRKKKQLVGEYYSHFFNG